METPDRSPTLGKRESRGESLFPVCCLYCYLSTCYTYIHKSGFPQLLPLLRKLALCAFLFQIIRLDTKLGSECGTYYLGLAVEAYRSCAIQDSTNIQNMMIAQLSICKASRAVYSRAHPLIETSLCCMSVLPSSSHCSARQSSTLRTARRTTHYDQRSSFCTKGVWNSREKTDLDGLTPIDIEKVLFRIKRTMGSFYSKGAQRVLLSVPRSLQHVIANIAVALDLA